MDNNDDRNNGSPCNLVMPSSIPVSITSAISPKGLSPIPMSRTITSGTSASASVAAQAAAASGKWRILYLWDYLYSIPLIRCWTTEII